MTDTAMAHSPVKRVAIQAAGSIGLKMLMDQELIPRETLKWLGLRLGLLGHPDRLHVLLLLHKHRELCVCQIMERTGMSQPRVSQLLQQLRGGHLVEGHRAGQKMMYSLSSDALLSGLLVLMERLQVKKGGKKSPA